MEFNNDLMKVMKELKVEPPKKVWKKPPTAMVNAPTHLREHHRHFLRMYFSTANLDATNYIYQEVILLLNSPDINRIEDKIGREKYLRLVAHANKYATIYSRMQLNIEIILKLQEKGDSEIMKEKIKEFRNEVLRLSRQLPAVNVAIWKLYFMLVSGCNLANLPVPRDGKYTTNAQKGLGGGVGGYI